MKYSTIALIQRILGCIGFMFMVAYPLNAEQDDQSARSVYLAEIHSLGSPAAYASVKLSKEVKRPVRARYAPDPSIVKLAMNIADETGIRRDVMHDHIVRESGYNPNARNPKSTATGLLQLIKGSHEAIAGRLLTKEEHFRLAKNPEYNLRLGAAHIKACMELMPGASSYNLWKKCHVQGHRNVGGDIRTAASYFKTDKNGWLSRGTIAMPWSNRAERNS